MRFKRKFFRNPLMGALEQGIEYLDGGPVLDAVEDDANLIGSLIDHDSGAELHLPVIDLDFPARLIPSSTNGHFHLYLDGMKPLTWDAYRRLLHALTEAGVIEPRYYFHCIRRGQSLVRKPGVFKPQKAIDAGVTI